MSRQPASTTASGFRMNRNFARDEYGNPIPIRQELFNCCFLLPQLEQSRGVDLRRLSPSRLTPLSPPYLVDPCANTSGVVDGANMIDRYRRSSGRSSSAEPQTGEPYLFRVDNQAQNSLTTPSASHNSRIPTWGVVP